ncbi:MAG: arylsulfatase [Alistipes sp.]|nr:arylsulfatase [Alistipes sp.]
MRSLGFVAGGVLCATPLFGQPGDKPNIVLILADDMGYGDVAALSAECKIPTPHLDRMVREGVSFSDAHTSSSVSSPTRYGLLTGRYNWRSTLKNGVLNGYSPPLIDPGRATLPSKLRELGYTTAGIGKWHLGWRWNNIEAGNDEVDFTKPITDGPVDRGFDYWYGISASLDMPPYVYVENDMPTALPDRVTSNTGMQMWRSGPTASDFSHEECLPNLTSRAVNYIEEQAGGDNPFFLYFPLPAPHTPILPVREFQGRSGLNPYGDFVMMVDWVVGEIRDALERSGAAENTILVFTADNGCSPAARIEELQQMGHYPSYIYRGHKADLYEGGHRVPCIVTWPAGAPPHQADQTVCLTDFMATFVALAGGTLADDEGEDSYNILPLITSADYVGPIREATVNHSIDGSFTIRQGSWKLLLAPGSGGWSYPRPGRDSTEGFPEVQLYNVLSDPAETNNLYDRYPDVVARMTDLMRRYIRQGRSTPGEPQPNDGGPVWAQLEGWY